MNNTSLMKHPRSLWSGTRHTAHWIRYALLTIALAFAPQAVGHPSLLFGPSDVSTLKSRASTSHQAIFQPLRQATDPYLGSNVDARGLVSWESRSAALGDLRDIGNALVVFAFVAQLDDNPQYFQLARDWLLRVTSFGTFDLDGTHDLVQGHLLAGAAIAFDFLAPRLSGSDAQAVIAGITRNANDLMSAGRGGMFWEREFLQNHNWINHAAVGLAALAVREDLPDTITSPWLNYAADNARTVNGMLNTIVDGTFHEGLAYSAYGLVWHLPFLSALQRSTATDLGNVGMLRAYGTARAHLHLPDAANQYILPTGDFYGFSLDDGLETLRYAASRFGDELAQAIADRWVSTVAPSTYAPELAQRVFEFLFYDPSVRSADLRSQALDWFGADLQAAVFRSSWESNGLVFALKTGSFGGNSGWDRNRTNPSAAGNLNFAHDHADDNGFYLYANGAWLAPEAAGYFIGHPDSPGPQANRTAFHNSLVIDGRGQLGEGVRTLGDLAAQNPWFFDRSGGIPFFGYTDDFGYAVGDGSRLYDSALGLRGWERHVLFVERRWIVLRDVIQSSAAHEYLWLCHMMDGVSRQDQWLHGQSKNGQALGVAIIAPSDWQLVSEQQAPVNINRLNPTGSVYSAAVRPSARSANATFLSALVPTTEAQWGSRPTVTAIDPNHPDSGLWIQDGSHRAAALFSDAPTEARSVGGFSLNGVSGTVGYDGANVTRALLVQGKALSDAQGVLIEQSQASRMLEVEGVQSDTLSLSGDGLYRPRVFAPRATRVLWNHASVGFHSDGNYIIVEATAAPTGQTQGTSGTSLNGSQKVQASAGCSAGGGSTGGFALTVLLLVCFVWLGGRYRIILSRVATRWPQSSLADRLRETQRRRAPDECRAASERADRHRRTQALTSPLE